MRSQIPLLRRRIGLRGRKILVEGQTSMTVDGDKLKAIVTGIIDIETVER